MPSAFEERRDGGQVNTIGEANNLNNSWRLDLMFSAPIIPDPDAKPMPDKK